MDDFWRGAAFGLVLFAPGLVALLTVVWWSVGNQVEQPGFSFGRNHALVWLGRHTDVYQSLTFLLQVGFNYRYMGGKWYWIWRVYFGEESKA
ncbi:MAG TPA: hypothetical protein VGK74_02525 [Symbiobacteriaceae bacterium]|jgi:hypothetical protein